MDLVMNLLFTVVSYEIVPVILKYVLNKKYNEKEAKKIATINSVVVWFLWTLLYVSVDMNKVGNIAAAFIWGFLAFTILKDNEKIMNEKNSEKDDTEVKELIEKLSK